MSHAQTPHKQWREEHAIEGEFYGPDEVIFCGTEACGHEAAVLIENRAGLVPLWPACLSAFEFGVLMKTRHPVSGLHE